MFVERVMAVDLRDSWDTYFEERRTHEVLLRVTVDPLNRSVATVSHWRRRVNARDQTLAILIGEHDALVAEEHYVCRNLRKDVSSLLFLLFDLFLVEELLHV